MEEIKKKYVGYGYHGGGRKKGSGTGTKRVTFNVSCQPEELERLNVLVKESGKSKSRFLLDKAFGLE